MARPKGSGSGGDEVLTPEQVVEEYWPFDGPHSDDTVVDAATAVARLVRYLSNATWPHKKHVASGPAVYRVLSQVTSAVYGLEQLLRQLGETADDLAEDTSMYDDRRDRPAAETALEVAATLADSLGRVEPLARVLHHATNLASHLGHEERRRAGQ